MTAFMASNKDTIGRMSRSLTSRSAVAGVAAGAGRAGQMCKCVHLYFSLPSGRILPAWENLSPTEKQKAEPPSPPDSGREAVFPSSPPHPESN